LAFDGGTGDVFAGVIVICPDVVYTVTPKGIVTLALPSADTKVPPFSAVVSVVVGVVMV
jgi:hypothetical protein